MNTKNNNINKRAVQNYLYKDLFPVRDATILLGPNPNDYLNLIQQKSQRIFAHETNKSIVEGLSKELYSRYPSLCIINDDLYYADPTQLIDMDMCCTFSYAKYLMLDLFRRQKSMNRNNNTFMITLALRDKLGFKIQTIIDGISKMIGENIIIVEKNRVVNIDKKTKFYELKANNLKNYKVKICTYKDSMPMISISIQY
jgi:hypothetical protein